MASQRGAGTADMPEKRDLKRASKYEMKERLSQARVLIFDGAGGRIMSLPRKLRLFVNRVSHESYERYLIKCRSLGTAPI